MKYIAIFDETGHDKKVKISKDGEFNFNSSSFPIESFIGGAFFIKEEKEIDLRNSLKEFENFCDNPKELKASKVLKWSLNNGASSITKLQLRRYNKFLDIFEEYVEFLNLNFIWKKRQIVDVIKSKIILSQNYKDKMNLKNILSMQLDHILYNILDKDIAQYVINNDFQNMLKIMKNKLKSNIQFYSQQTDQRSKDHYENQKDFFKAMDFYNYKKNDELYNEDFNYDLIVKGIIKVMEERNTSDVDVNFIVDSYDNINKIFEKNFHKCQYLDSKEEVLLAIPDIFISFFGKLLSSIELYLKKLEKLDKKVLADTFFEVNEEQFNLMKRINNVFNFGRRHSHFSSYVDNGCPHIAVLFAYINYFSYFDSIEEYNEIDKMMHKEKVNELACDKRTNYVQQRAFVEHLIKI